MSDYSELPMLDLDHPSLKPKVEYYHVAEEILISKHKSEGGDIIGANKKHFNHIASHCHEDPRWIALAKRSTAEMLKNYNFSKKSTIVLDFATNAGLIARQLEPYTKQIVGVDISETPVVLFNQWVSEKGISSEKMHAVAVELKGEDGELDGLKFDVITCAASYHHFEDINKMTKMLSYFLKPNGVLLVVDFTKAESEEALPTDDSHDSSVPHKVGLTAEIMRDAFVEAGLIQFRFEDFSRVRMLGNESTLFLASGKKPGADL